MTPVDYLVVGGYLAGITAFGSWLGRFHKTTADYFLTGRSVPGLGDLLHHRRHRDQHAVVHRRAGGGLRRRLRFLQLAAGFILGRALVALLLVPAYFAGDLLTSYDLLRQRFGPAVKNLSAGLFIVHALARRRHPPVCDGAGDRRGDGHPGHAWSSSCSAW